MVDERPEAQRSGDLSIAGEAGRWQSEQRGAQASRASGGRLATLVLAVLVVIWLALCGVAVALTVDIATTPDAGEAMIILPPMYCVLSAIGTGLVIDIRSRMLGRGPSVGRIVGSVLSGAFAALIVGTGLAFALAVGLTALFTALFGDDLSDPVVSAAMVLVGLITLFVLPVITGVGAVLYYVSAWTLPGRRKPDQIASDQGRSARPRQSSATPNELSLPAPNQLSRPVGPTYWTVTRDRAAIDWRKAVRWFTNGFVLVAMLVVAANFVARDGLPGLVTFLLGFILYALIPMIVVAPIVALWFIARAMRAR